MSVISDSDDSSDDYVVEKRRKFPQGTLHSDATPLLQFKFPQPIFNRKLKIAHKLHKETESVASDSSEEGDWVDINEKKNDVTEQSVINLLLNNTKQDVLEKDECEIVVKIPEEEEGRDVKKVNQISHLNSIKLCNKYMHTTNLFGLITFGRSCNLKCDSFIVRVISNSMLSNVPELYSENGFLPVRQWDQTVLRNVLQYFNGFIRPSRKFDLRKVLSFQALDSMSSNDAVILFVAGLRSLGIDTRLVCSFRPIALNYAKKRKRVKKIKCDKTAKIRIDYKKLNNNKVISSSEDSECSEITVTCSESEIENLALLQNECYVLSAEVFLPALDKYVPCTPSCVDVYNTIKYIRSSKCIYSFGYSSTQQNEDYCPYPGRSPVDLSMRYDGNYCSSSQDKRLPEKVIASILDKFKRLCDLDVAFDMNQVPRTNIFSRDTDDAALVRNIILSQALPAKISDYKKHPLYALERHLLQNEIIHLKNTDIAGSLRNGEEVFFRADVHVCKSANNWFKEGKVVKKNERPVKFIKRSANSKSEATTIGLYGDWQMQVYKPPPVKNGKIERNEYKNIEIYTPSMVPSGAVHLILTDINIVAKSLQIDCVPAVVGWSFSRYGSKPIQKGYVVPKENLKTLLKAWLKYIRKYNVKKQKTTSEHALNNWKKLMRRFFLWQRIKTQYDILTNGDLKATEEDCKNPVPQDLEIIDLPVNFDGEKENLPMKAKVEETCPIVVIDSENKENSKISDTFDVTAKIRAKSGNCRRSERISLRCRNLIK